MKAIFRTTIVGVQPVPWSVPTIGNMTTKAGKRCRFTTRNKELETWQAYVSTCARAEYDKPEPFLGPIDVRMTFLHRSDNQIGQPCFQGVRLNLKKQQYVKAGSPIADLDNLAKGTIDALQGIVFGNDVQVCQQRQRRLFNPLAGVIITIYPMDPTSVTWTEDWE